MSATSIGISTDTPVRRAARERFRELGYPTTRHEDWKYTNVAPIARLEFEAGSAEIDVAALCRNPLFDLGCLRLVFVNGQYSKELSTLSSRLLDEPDNPHLARYAEFAERAFVAQNTAFFEDGALLRIPMGAIWREPVHVIYVSAAGARPTVSYPRTLILAGRNSQATIIETYLGMNDATYFTNAVTELVAEEGAVVSHYRVGAEAGGAFHVGLLRTEQQRGSNVTARSISLGGALVRNEVRAVLAGEGAETTLDGLYVARGKQHVDNHTTIEHAMPRGSSRELYKGVLDEEAEGVFHGCIIVRPDARKTDAVQRNQNLLLSGEARVNSKPQLEIHADDVRCTHGATVGQVDADALFYLQARGIGRRRARRMLTFAFAGQILDRIEPSVLRERLREQVIERLP